MPIISALGKLEDGYKTEASLGYTVSSSKPERQNETKPESRYRKG